MPSDPQDDGDRSNGCTATRVRTFAASSAFCASSTAVSKPKVCHGGEGERCSQSSDEWQCRPGQARAGPGAQQAAAAPGLARRSKGSPGAELMRHGLALSSISMSLSIDLGTAMTAETARRLRRSDVAAGGQQCHTVPPCDRTCVGSTARSPLGCKVSTPARPRPPHPSRARGCARTPA